MDTYDMFEAGRADDGEAYFTSLTRELEACDEGSTWMVREAA